MSSLATFPFEAAKKALSNRIIPAISQTAHAANKTVCFQEIAVSFAGIL